MAKLHIDIQAGLLDVEGEPEFIKEIVAQLKGELRGAALTAPLVSTNQNSSEQNTTHASSAAPRLSTSQDDSQRKFKKKSPKKESNSLIKELDTGLKGAENSLDSYINKYNPKANFEKTLVFTKYLEDQHAGTPITRDHIYTCYNNSGSKFPGNLYQNVIDTGHKGWLHTSDVDNVSLTPIGRNKLMELEQGAKTDSSN